MDDFRMELKAALETIDTRIRMLEHTVNDVIIGSLESAATEYADNEAFDAFRGKYGERLLPLVAPHKKLFGEDYDLERALYDDLKGMDGYGTEGFDEDAVMESRIADLEARFKSLKEDVEEIKDDAGPEAEVSIEEIPEEQLMQELKDALDEGPSTSDE